MTPTDFAALLEVITQFGFSSVFLWLFVREMNRHDHTRDEYHRDLREIAGLRANHLLSQGHDSSTPTQEE